MGKGRIMQRQGFPKGGGVKMPDIGKAGNTSSQSKSSIPPSKGAGQFSHLPPPGHYSNAGVKGNGPRTERAPVTKPGPRWGHMPDTPAATD